MTPRRLVTCTLVILSLWIIMALAWPLPSALAGFTPTPRPTTPSGTTPAPTTPSGPTPGPTATKPEKEPKGTLTPTVTQTVNPLTATPGLMPKTGRHAASGGEMPAAQLMGIIILGMIVAGMTVRRLSKSGNR
jgi:hypothetical protein